MLTGYSKGGVSSWYIYCNCLFDCGEGIGVALLNNVYKIDSVFLTHGHLDHIGGLTGFIAQRLKGKGANEKPLNIFYPVDWQSTIHDMWRFINIHLNPPQSQFTLIPISGPGYLGQISKSTYIECFETKHVEDKRTLGYKIIEKRHRLRADLKDANISFLKKQGWKVDEDYEQCIFCYTGDTKRLDNKIYGNPDVLLHECTIIDSEVFKVETGHCCLTDLKGIQCKNLVLCHFSSRYTYDQITTALEKAQIKCNFIWEGTIY